MKRGVMWGIIAGVAAIGLAAGVGVWALQLAAQEPVKVAERYLQALEDGDFAAIEPLLPETVDAQQLERTFAGATGYIEEFSFTSSEQAPKLLSVRADVVLAGEPTTIHFMLDSGGPTPKLTDFLGRLDVTTPVGDSVSVSGVLAPLDVMLLPAVYTVGPAPAEILTGALEVAVATSEPTAVALEPTLAPEATPLAQEQIDAYATACAAATDAVPADCGLRVPWAADLASLDRIAFRIDTMPTVAVAADARSFAATGGIIVATASGTTRDGAAASFTYRADDWALRGIVQFAGNEMQLLVG